MFKNRNNFYYVDFCLFLHHNKFLFITGLWLIIQRIKHLPVSKYISVFHLSHTLSHNWLWLRCMGIVDLATSIYEIISSLCLTLKISLITTWQNDLYSIWYYQTIFLSFTAFETRGATKFDWKFYRLYINCL